MKERSSSPPQQESLNARDLYIQVIEFGVKNRQWEEALWNGLKMLNQAEATEFRDTYLPMLATGDFLIEHRDLRGNFGGYKSCFTQINRSVSIGPGVLVLGKDSTYKPGDQITGEAAIYNGAKFELNWGESPNVPKSRPTTKAEAPPINSLSNGCTQWNKVVGINQVRVYS